mmetsp:Transcript_61363/g.163161  ORF Transcript_61363/g.163161 Transcript_61363/m.163161 type:complete len:256 (+) Transcript_61363:2379-3146(+)
MMHARVCVQLELKVWAKVRITLKRVGMKTASTWLFLNVLLSNFENCSASLSKFSSPISTAFPSISSSSSPSSSAPSVQTSTSSSTSSIHSMFRPTTCSSKPAPEGSQKSLARPQTKDISASMALCLISESFCWPHNTMRHPQSSCKPFALKNSGSSVAALIRHVSVSFSWVSVSLLLAKTWKTLTTAGMTGTSACALSGATSSMSSRTNCALAARISADGLPRQTPTCSTNCPPLVTKPSPMVSTSSFKIISAAT